MQLSSFAYLQLSMFHAETIEVESCMLLWQVCEALVVSALIVEDLQLAVHAVKQFCLPAVQHVPCRLLMLSLACCCKKLTLDISTASHQSFQVHPVQ